MKHLLNQIGTYPRLPGLFWEFGGFRPYEGRNREPSTINKPTCLAYFVRLLDNTAWLLIVSAASVVFAAFLAATASICTIRSRNRREVSDRLRTYLSAYSYRVAAAVLKYLEGRHFRQAAISPPSLEIGIESGLASELHFSELSLDVGAEFEVAHIPNFSSKRLWRWKLCADARHLPFKDSSFSTILSVHTIDHIPEIDSVLSELARVLRPGGRAYLSGLGPRFLVAGPLGLLLRTFGRADLAQRVGRWLAKQYHQYHFYSRDEWATLLSSHGLRLLHFDEFNRGLWGDIWVLNHYWFGKKGGYFLFDLMLKSPLRSVAESFLKWATHALATSQVAYEEAHPHESGNDIFMAVEKFTSLSVGSREATHRSPTLVTESSGHIAPHNAI